MKLSFMTWSCPEWDCNQILKAAKKYGYQGVEIRVECNHKHKIELNLSKKDRSLAKRMFKEEGIEIPCIATSLQFAIPDDKERRENIEKLKKYIELASDIGSPYIRVFGGNFMPLEPKVAAQKCGLALREAAEFAEGTDAEILLETHDFFSVSSRARQVIKEANHRKVNILWDIMHPQREMEDVEETYNHLRGFVRHLHIHDGFYSPEGKIEVCLLGEGIIDHEMPMWFLKSDNFRGYFSLEIIGKGEPEKWFKQYAEKFREIESSL